MDDVVAEARQGILQLVRLLRAITRHLNSRRQTRDGVVETDPFVQWFDQQLPGMRNQLNSNDHVDDAELAGRFESAFVPEWAEHASRVVESIPAGHAVYADPQVRAARQEFANVRSRQGRAALGEGLMQARQRLAADPTQRTGPTGGPTGSQVGAQGAPTPSSPAAGGAGPAPGAAATPSAAAAAGPYGDRQQTQPIQAPQPPPAPQAGPVPAQPAPAQAVQAEERPGFVRTLPAAKENEIVLDVEMLGRAGKLVVQADESCKQATVTVRTDLESGPSVAAIRAAGVLKQRADGGLSVSVPSPDEMSAANSMAFNDSGGNSFVFNNYGNVGTQIGVLGAGEVLDNGVLIARGQPAPVEITAVVPPGTVVKARTDAASIETEGRLGAVDVRTTSGSIVVGNAGTVHAASSSGRIDVAEVGGPEGGSAQVESQQGAVTVHATTGGRIHASSGSGSVTVTATDAALAGRLVVDASSTTGRVSKPDGATVTGVRSAHETGGERSFRDGWTQQQQAGVRDR